MKRSSNEASVAARERLNAILARADDWFDRFLGALWPLLAALALIAFLCTIARYP